MPKRASSVAMASVSTTISCVIARKTVRMAVTKCNVVSVKKKAFGKGG